MTLNSHDGCKRSWMRRTALEHLSPPHQLRLQQSTAIMTATFAAAPQPLLLPAEVEQSITASGVLLLLGSGMFLILRDTLNLVGSLGQH